MASGHCSAATYRAPHRQPHLADVRGGRSSGVGVARLALLEHAGMGGEMSSLWQGGQARGCYPITRLTLRARPCKLACQQPASSGTHRGAASGQGVGRLCWLAGRHLWRHVASAGPVLACRHASVEAAGAKAGQGQGLGGSGGRLQPAVAAVCLQQQGGAASAASQDGGVGGAPGRVGFSVPWSGVLRGAQAGIRACNIPPTCHPWAPTPHHPAHLTTNSGTSPAAGTLGGHMPGAAIAIQGPCRGEPGSGMSGAGG